MRTPGTTPPRVSFTLLACSMALALVACENDAADRGIGPAPVSLEASAGGLALPPPLPPSSGPVFYVATTGSDTNPGTVDAPWQTIQKAMNDAQAGQLVYVRAGTYETGGAFGTDADTYRWDTACAADAPCSLVAFPGERPVIHGQVRISGSYLRLSGFVIEGPLSTDATSPTGRRANQVWLNEAHHVEFSRNEVRYNDYHAGVKLDSVHHAQILGNYIHDNGRFSLPIDPITGESTSNTDQGIYWGSTNGDGNLVANNVIEHNRAKGLQLYPNGTYDVIVTQNTIVDNGSAGILINGKTDRIRVVNNVVAFNLGKQIRVLKGNANLILGNLVFSPKRSYSAIENKTLSIVQDNLAADPRFVNRTGHDLHLLAGSPAVDRAYADYSAGTDIEGTPRPLGGGPDLGAYER